MIMRKISRKTKRASPVRRKAWGHGHERHEEIVTAAKRLFMREGYEAVTTRQLAQEVGLSQTGLYVYFKSKDEILAEIRRSAFGRLTERFRDIAGRTLGTTMLKRLLAGYLEFALENADEYQLMFMVTHASLKQAAKSFDRPAAEQPVVMQPVVIFRDQMAKLVDSGVLRRVDPTVTTQMLWGALHGLATLLITHPTFPWVDRRLLIDSMVDTLNRGLTKPS